MKLKDLPSMICFIASIGFILSIVPTVILYPKDSGTSVAISLIGGLFFLLLSLILDLEVRISKLEKLNYTSSKTSGEKE